jgi:hypothetical protein
MLEHVFDEAVARPQVEHMGPIHDGEHQEQRHLVSLLVRHDGHVAIEFGLVERPEELFRSLRDLGVGGEQAIESLQIDRGVVPLFADVFESDRGAVAVLGCAHRNLPSPLVLRLAAEELV